MFKSCVSWDPVIFPGHSCSGRVPGASSMVRSALGTAAPSAGLFWGHQAPWVRVRAGCLMSHYTLQPSVAGLSSGLSARFRGHLGVQKPWLLQ